MMAAEEPKDILFREDHASTNGLTEEVISFHEYKRRIEEHFAKEKYQEITPHDRGEKCIKATLGALVQRPPSFAIYSVPSKLRKVNEDAYSPRMVSIGPIHHGRNDLLKMEEHKWRYMLFLLARTSDPVKAVEKCWEAIRSLQQEVPGYYAEDLNIMTRNKLKEILLVDGCFILELFIRFLEDKNDDEIISSAWMISTIKHDLALLENQIPFCVLDKLFSIVRSPSLEPEPEPFPYSLTLMYALCFFDLPLNSRVLEVLDSPRPCEAARHLNNARHLLEMLHIFHRPPLSEAEVPKVNHDTLGSKHCATNDLESGLEIGRASTNSTGLLELADRPPFSDTDQQPKVEHDTTFGFKRCATNLLEHGIKIKSVSKNNGLLEITFNNGVIQFPAISIDDQMETIFRNLIAFEQCSVGGTNHITSYAMLMKRLIRSPQDKELLEEKGIITNTLSSSGEDASTFFNSICSQVIVPKDFYLYFVRICEKVNNYESDWDCRRIKAYLGVKLRKSVATLKHKYFPNPWSYMSVGAAVVLIVLAFLQTIYTMRSFFSAR